MLPLEALLSIELQWRQTVVVGLPGETAFLPFATTVPDTAIGMTDGGLWALARYASDPARPGRLFDPNSSKGLIFLCPLLDWVPRRVMGQVNVVASSAGVSFEDLWNEFPWRYVIRSALETARRRLYVDAALDWLTYLGVADEFELELSSLGLHPQDLTAPRPRLDDFRT